MERDKAHKRAVSPQMERYMEIIVEELQTGEKTMRELARKHNINRAQCKNLITNLTFVVPIYEYSTKTDVTYGLLK